MWGYQREQVTSNGPVLPDPDRTEQEILAERFGLGPLQPLLEDPSVDSIFLDGPKRVDLRTTLNCGSCGVTCTV